MLYIHIIQGTHLFHSYGSSIHTSHYTPSHKDLHPNVLPAGKGIYVPTGYNANIAALIYSKVVITYGRSRCLVPLLVYGWYVTKLVI